MFSKFQIVWFKRDLRLQDHEPLDMALSSIAEFGKVLPLYCYEPQMLSEPDFAMQHFEFISETLHEMQLDITSKGGLLHVKSGNIVDIFKRLYNTGRLTRILAYKETTGKYGFDRDKAVVAWSKKHSIPFIELNQNGVKRGREYRETGFHFDHYLSWACGSELCAWPHPIMKSISPEEIWQKWNITEPFEKSMQELRSYISDKDKPLRLKGGRSYAEELKNSFFTEKRLTDYPGSISSPNTAVTGCSRISPYLAYGVVSQRELVQHAVKYGNLEKLSITKDQNITLPGFTEGVRFFLERLYWRSAFLQRFELKPQIEHEVEDIKMVGIREQEFEEELFEAWTQGQTGVPIIDAAMRMLNETGWINMRMRGTLLSFAANELWLHWRKPGLYLARQFLDYEPAIHWHQMQIHSATSLAQPLIYNPIKQAQEQDESGVFIRKWVPELKQLQTPEIFEPWTGDTADLKKSGVKLGVTYPKPIVPLDAAAECAKLIIQAAKAGEPIPKLGYAKQRVLRLSQKMQGSLF